jgi:endonuclease/exonuclease/phosphatase (EEP) superfamily protein YafD
MNDKPLRGRSNDVILLPMCFAWGRATAPILRLISSLAAAGTVVVLLLTLGGFAARWWWRLEQVCHFRVQYFWLLALAAVVLVAARRRRLAAVAAAGSLVNGAAILPIYWPAPSPNAVGPAVRLIAFNLNSQNRQRDEVLSFLREQRADLVLLTEVGAAWAEAVGELSDLYPHRRVVPREDNFGIALLSRIPWSSVETIELGRAEVPTVVARFEIDGCDIALVGTHPLPPGSREMAALRNEQLVELARFVQQQDNGIIMAGDLNTTDFSPHFADLLVAANLRDTRQGLGIQPSWGPFPLLEIAIDHCLVSPEIAVLRRTVGPHLGSDHRPVIVDLQLPVSTGRIGHE